MITARPKRGAAVLAAAAVVVALLIAIASGTTPAVRAPLALCAFLVAPGMSLLLGLRVRGDLLTLASLVCGISIAADVLGSMLLLATHVATVSNLLILLEALCLASVPTAMFTQSTDGERP